MRTVQRAVAAAIISSSLLWGAGVASAAARPQPKVAPTRPTVSSRDTAAFRQRIAEVAEDAGVSPARLIIECQRDGTVMVWWNDNHVAHWWDPWCALHTWLGYAQQY